jgi:hypothetical protein
LTIADARRAARKQSAAAVRVSVFLIMLRLDGVASRLFGTQPIEIEVEVSMSEGALLVRW